MVAGYGTTASDWEAFIWDAYGINPGEQNEVWRAEPTTRIPEPGELALLGLGRGGIVAFQVKKRVSRSWLT